MTQMLLNPVGAFHHEENPIAVRLDSLGNKVIGMIDNGKENAELFLDHIQSRMQGAYPIADVLRLRKPISGIPASYAQEFLDQCDFVVNAFGD